MRSYYGRSCSKNGGTSSRCTAQGSRTAVLPYPTSNRMMAGTPTKHDPANRAVDCDYIAGIE
jgi:hypothetical protein